MVKTGSGVVSAIAPQAQNNPGPNEELMNRSEMPLHALGCRHTQASGCLSHHTYLLAWGLVQDMRPQVRPNDSESTATLGRIISRILTELSMYPHRGLLGWY